MLPVTKLPILKKTSEGFILTSDYGITQRFEDFQTDNLIRAGIDVTKPTDFNTGKESIQDLDNVTNIVNELIK